MKSRAFIRKAAVVLFRLVLWQVGSALIDDSIIFIDPLDMVMALLIQSPSSGLWKTIASSFGKINLGSLSAFFLGILPGNGGYRFPLLRELLEPVILLMKSTPVTFFVILAFIWIGSKQPSVFISFLVVSPIIYVNTIAGLKSTDKKLLEMAQVFRISTRRRIRLIYVPTLLPHPTNGCRATLGISWESGIVTRVIGVPSSSIGEKLYMTKIYLSTADPFAWAFVIIVISALFEQLFLYLLKKVTGRSGYHEH